MSDAIPTTTMPEPLECPHCGAYQDWVWAMQLSGMGWCRPNSHKACLERAAAEERKKLIALAERRAGIPQKHRNWDWGRLEFQQEDTPAWQFMRWMQRKPNTIGVLRENAIAVADVAQWKPSDGWLYIEGTQGMGKSTLAAAIVRQLVSPPTADEWVCPDGSPWVMGVHSMRPGYRRKKAKAHWPAQYVDWAELEKRIGQSWSGDRDPLKQALKVRVLVIDDLPANRSIRFMEAIENLLCARYRDGLPTVITSNVPYLSAVDADKPVYGHRVADRLAEVCQAVTLRGPSWRNPPDPPKRRKVVEGKTAAAEQSKQEGMF